MFYIFSGYHFGMPPGFIRMGQPIEFLLIELAYFLLVTGSSLYIYFKTKEIYDLTKHKGIYHFRNIFLYFALAYFFRLAQLMLMFSRQIFYLDIFPRQFMPYNFFFVTYFSTLAIMSVIISSNARNIKLNNTKLNILLHAVSFVVSVLSILYLTPFALVLLQTLTFMAGLIAILAGTKGKASSHITQNKVTYVLLFIFWVVNIFAFQGMHVPLEIKLPVYLVSVGVFISILFRVRKRLIHAEKKR